MIPLNAVPSLTDKLHNSLILHYFGENPPISFDPKAQITANRIIDLERLHAEIAANPGTPLKALEAIELPNIGLKYGLKILMTVGAITRARIKGHPHAYGYWSAIA